MKRKQLLETTLSEEETLEEVADWLNKKFNGKGVEIKVIDWNKNEKYNYSPSNLLQEYAKYQAERMYSEKEMLDFAWFLIENVGQYSNDRKAHFEGKYLEQFKKK